MPSLYKYHFTIKTHLAVFSHIVKPSFCPLRMWLSGTSSFLGAIAVRLQLSEGSTDPVKPALRAFRSNQLSGHIFGCNTSFLGVEAFRHSFGQIQLPDPSFLGMPASW